MWRSVQKVTAAGLGLCNWVYSDFLELWMSFQGAIVEKEAT